MLSYSQDPKWADITPIEQNEGGPRPLAAIAYTDEYSEAMSYLRAVMAKNEYSQRVLDLTEHIINLNPAHYTVWLYRAKTLTLLSSDLRAEIRWLNPTALKHLKNYQIWQHRQTIISLLGDAAGEPEFINEMLKADAKNYHVWSYRQWLVKEFKLFEDEGKGGEGEVWNGTKELAWIEEMLKQDVRNNSAWNHRWFVVFGCNQGNKEDMDVVQREIDYTTTLIRLSPNNQSPWLYLRGILTHSNLPLSHITLIALEYANIESANPESANPNNLAQISSSHALDILVDIYSQSPTDDTQKAKARKALTLLEKYDPVRRPYWVYKRGVLGLGEGEGEVGA